MKKRDPLLDLLKPEVVDDAPPPVLLPYQQRWVADDSPLKVAEKSRRIGLTWAEAADDALIAASADGSNVFYISATQDMAIEYIEAAAMWARAYDLAAGEVEQGVFEDVGDDGSSKSILTYKINFPKSGHRIVALSSRPANLRGKQGVIVIDEGAFAPDLAGLIKAAMAMLMWGDKVRILSTHNGDDNPFNELIEEIRSEKRKGVVHRITFAEAVADGLYRRVCLRKGRIWTQEAEDAWVADVRGFYADDAAEELDVVPSQGGGTYLPLALIESRMVASCPIVRKKWSKEFGLLPEPVRRAEVAEWLEEEVAPHLARLDKRRQHCAGGDFGRVGDLSVLTGLEEGSDLVRRPRLVVEISNCPFRQQHQIYFFVLGGLPRFRSAALDAGGNGADVAEACADKFGHTRVEQVKLSEMFYLEQMPKFKAALEDGTLDALPKDSQWRDDLRAIKKIGGVPKIPRAKTQQADGPKLQRHGDAAISLFLANYAAKRDVIPTAGYVDVPRRELPSGPGNSDDAFSRRWGRRPDSGGFDGVI